MGGGILLCLVSRCGQPCLQAAENTLLPCITAAVGEATMSVFACVKESLQTATACKKCLASLACCVTDSCSFCECSCANLLRFTAPISSPTRIEQPWLFQPQCHFAYMGTPACKDCDGKRVYKSVDCQQSMYLHYHDYLLDGRWVLTPGLDDDDRTALVRNLGDGFDDEECPERESWKWDMRSTRAPGFLFCFCRRGRSGLQFFFFFFWGGGASEADQGSRISLNFLEMRSTRVPTD